MMSKSKIKLCFRCFDTSASGKACRLCCGHAEFRAEPADLILCTPSSRVFRRGRSAAVPGEGALEDDALDGGDEGLLDF
jgi:hypothetical protein